MPKNKMQDLRNMLFETMERLLDDDDATMDQDRAETIAKVAQVVVNSAKVEVDFLKTTGAGGSEFLQAGSPPRLNAVKPVGQLRALTVSGDSYEELCTKCPLPECNEKSPECLIQIERRAA